MAAIQEGIKLVGVGKAGSKDCPAGLVAEIVRELRQGDVAPVARTVFFTGLFLKELNADEAPLAELLPAGALAGVGALIDELAPGMPERIRTLTLKILGADILDVAESRMVGDYLFSPESPDVCRALIATALRIRHAETDEYAGIIEAIHAVIDPFYDSVTHSKSRSPFKESKPLVQLAEPFDGVNHSHLLTFALAGHLTGNGWKVLSIAGENPGPKQGINVLDLARDLDVPMLRPDMDAVFDLCSDGGVNSKVPMKKKWGWCLNTADLSPRFAEWTTLRRQMIKRPFLATVEKLINPLRADVLLSSIYHPTFKGRLGDIAHRAGFKASVVAFRSVEGGLGLSLARASNVTCTLSCSDGSVIEEKFVFHPAEFGFEHEKDQKLEAVSAAGDAAKTIKFLESGSSGDTSFDQRLKFTLAVYGRAFEWLSEHWHLA